MIKINKEQYQKALNVDLVPFLQGRGYELIRSGREYYLKGHDSLKISNNLWCWHSRGGIGGNAIDFLVKYENIPFNDAVLMLSNNCCSNINNTPPNIEKIKKLNIPYRNKNNKRVLAYLHKTRGIDSEIVLNLISEGKIFESQQTHNCVFVGYDSSGNAKYATMRGTFSEPEKGYKQDVLDSDKSYGFCMDGTSNKVYVFESAIDALSHATLYKIQNKDWQRDFRISLGGTSEKALDRLLCDNKDISFIEFCLDNDETGIKTSLKLSNIYVKQGFATKISHPKYKDYNEDLLIAINDSEQL